MDNPYRLQSRRDVYRNPWIYVREDKVVRNGGESATFGVIEMIAGASVLALNGSHEVYLIKEYKYGVERSTMEVIGGAIEEGETPLSAAKREMKEEAGVTAREWIDLGSLDPFTTIVRSPNYLFLALEVQEGESNPDQGEVLELVKLPFHRVLEMVMSSEITHAATCVLVLKAARYLESLRGESLP